MKKTNKPVFKSYVQNQAALLPPSLDELIEVNHPVRVVNQVIEQIDIDPLLKKYKGGGTSSFHPRMMMKVMVYSYLSNIYSSRKMEAALKENIHFMWLSGMNQPDHNTLNRFRSERLKDVLKQVFGKVVEVLVNMGHVSLKEVYTDGTKIEANANRYTFVWGNAMRTSKEKMEHQLRELWEYAQSIAREELKDETTTTFAPIDAEQVKQTIEKIDAALANKPADKKVKQKVKYAKRNWPDKINQYKEQEKILMGRNSYSKTDTDATFMRIKEDHMRNGQLKPAYNLQLSTHEQFILNYTIHQNPTDTKTLPSHIESYKNLYGVFPKDLVADAGYGSQENYELLERNGIAGYVKYNSFDRQRKEGFIEQQKEYDAENDCYYCPAGKPLYAVAEKTSTKKNSYPSTQVIYRNISCQYCPLKEICNPHYSYKVLRINERLVELRQAAWDRLCSYKGIKLRKKRCHDVETVFAQLKHNKGFKRFMLRGIKKVEIESGLLAIAHNLLKMTD